MKCKLLFSLTCIALCLSCVVQQFGFIERGGVVEESYSIEKEFASALLSIMPEMSEEQSVGYRGHDSVYIIDGVLYRSFPLFSEDNPNCAPSGEHRVLSYDWPQVRWLFRQEVFEGK